MSILRLAAIAVIMAALCVAVPINVALDTNGGVATQSSTDFGGLASRANDGNTDGDYFGGNSVSHTAFEQGAWWDVNFNTPYVISEITVFNRTDCCQDRINPYSEYLYDALSNLVWSSTGNNIVLPATTSTFAVPSVTASRLRIQLDGRNWLQLAEVQVLGDKEGSSVVPEPSTYSLMAGGLALLGMLRRRKQ